MADHILAQILSARCYYQPESIPDQVNKSAPTYRPTSSQFRNNAVRDIPKAVEGVKKRGRPKLSSGEGAQHKDRRTQIRHAQRTYRKKKEVMIRSMKSRVAELEESMSKMSGSLRDFYQMAIQSDIHVTHPRLFEQLRKTVNCIDRAGGSMEGVPAESGHFASHPGTRADLDVTTSFGYMIESKTPANFETQSHETSNPPSEETLFVERPLDGGVTCSYSFQESDPSRLLQRYCLEYIYRLFSDPRSDPQEFFRVFRLVPCVKYREKMGLYLLCLVRSGSGETLEFPALPFYCIGGAGTHYPRLQGDGSPIYPENMRLPRRILGSLLGSHSSKDASSTDRQTLLKLAGLDGMWFDCQDVVGYLREKGIQTHGTSFGFLTSLWREIFSRDGSLPSSTRMLNAPPSSPRVDSEAGIPVSLSLDVDRFFKLILKNMVILGRSPGFRASDVEAAFRESVRVEFE